MNIVTLFLMAILLVSCSKGVEQKPVLQSGTGPSPTQGQTQTGGSAVPGVSFAEIVVSASVSEKPFIVQYVGNSQEGKTLTYQFRWYVDGALVPEATGNTLERSYFNKNAIVEAEVIPVYEGVAGAPFRTAAVTVKNSPPSIVSVSLSPLPAYPGDELSALPESKDWDNDRIMYTAQWKVNDKEISGVNELVLKTSTLKKKDRILVMVTPYDGADYGNPVMSSYVVLSNRPPEFTSVPPSGPVSGGVYAYQLAAKDPDGDKLTYALIKEPVGMTINASTGMIRWEVPSASDKEEVTVQVSVDDGDGGKAVQEFSLTTTKK